MMRSAIWKQSKIEHDTTEFPFRCKASVSGKWARATDSHTLQIHCRISEVSVKHSSLKHLLDMLQRCYSCYNEFPTYQINSGCAGWGKSMDSAAKAAQTSSTRATNTASTVWSNLHWMNEHTAIPKCSKSCTSESRRPSRSITHRFKGGLASANWK